MSGPTGRVWNSVLHSLFQLGTRGMQLDQCAQALEFGEALDEGQDALVAAAQPLGLRPWRGRLAKQSSSAQ